MIYARCLAHSIRTHVPEKASGVISRITGSAWLLFHFAEQNVNPRDLIIAEDLIAESDLLIDGSDLGDCGHPQLSGVFGGSLIYRAFMSHAFERAQHLLIKRHGGSRAVLSGVPPP